MESSMLMGRVVGGGLVTLEPKTLSPIFNLKPSSSLTFKASQSSSPPLSLKPQSLNLNKTPFFSTIIRRKQAYPTLPNATNSTTPIDTIGDDGDNGGGKRGIRGWVELVGEVLSTAFPVWVALGCLLGLVRPNSFNWIQPKWTILGITLTMLGMGMTLTFDDLRDAFAMPKELFAGFVLQYSVCYLHLSEMNLF
ncbi:hypothetical protein GIB67_038990 [Kingdonia uniflora]|uniref:Uncharacterized protein n=1 Tax=Kingdonia uniflora TaxID=39325 RepID=A0A7J7P6K6_9MAGN|nr:hypothetical protein GIB67_038990 [Kingdonia uniflora]